MDKHHLRGAGHLVNVANVKSGINPIQVANAMINEDDQEDLDRVFAEKVKSLEKELGVNLSDSVAGSDTESVTGVKQQPAKPSTSIGKQIESSQLPLARPTITTEPYYNEGITINGGEIDAPPLAYPQVNPSDRYTTIAERTDEQERHYRINSVLHEISPSGRMTYSIEREKREELKAIMLNEIDNLKEDLVNDGVDEKTLPVVSSKSSYEEIESAHRMLRLKNDRSKYCSLANELLIFGANALETVFDGKRVFFGKYRPDLTGWNRQVHMKLKRLRHDTSSIVSNIMQDYNISPTTRIMLELIPNACMYSSARKRQLVANDNPFKEE